MKYEFVCSACDHVQTNDLSIPEFEKAKEAGVECKACEATADYQFSTAGVQFCFKGDAWADKNYKEKKYRKNRSKYMAQRQDKNHIRPTLKPNYKGQEADSWKEAQEAARDDGKQTASYEPLVQREKIQEGK
jgi:predicted nucleic acid-binding Zn ribbon protein